MTRRTEKGPEKKKKKKKVQKTSKKGDAAQVVGGL